MKVLEMGVINELALIAWLKADGDYVKLHESVCEIESGNLTLEVLAEVSGILRIIAQVGDTLEIGAIFCKIETEAILSPKVNPKSKNVATVYSFNFVHHLT